MPSYLRYDEIINNTAKKNNLPRHLITHRLLCGSDNFDILIGKMSGAELDAYVSLWIQDGMPDVANGFDAKLEGYERYLSCDNSAYKKIDYNHLKDGKKAIDAMRDILSSK